jgi:hypothetical protein
MKEAASVYQSNYKNYIVYIKAGELQNAIEIKNSSVRPSLNAYQNMQQDLLTHITREVAEESEAVSSYSSVSAWVLFFIGLVPFVYAIGKLIYISVILRFRTQRKEL